MQFLWKYLVYLILNNRSLPIDRFFQNNFLGGGGLGLIEV